MSASSPPPDGTPTTGDTPPPDGTPTTGSSPSTAQLLLANPRIRRAAKFTLAAIVTTLIATLIPLLVAWIQSASSEDDAQPLDAAVSYGYRFNEPTCGGAWLFPGHQKPPDPSHGNVISTWAHKADGIDLHETDLILDIQGRHSDAVNIQRLRVIDLERAPLPKGVTGETPACGGKVNVRLFDIALGDHLPKVLEFNPKTDESAKSDALSYFVTAENTEKFLVFARTEQSGFNTEHACNCLMKWRLAVDWTYHGHEGTLVVDDHGAPFRTVDGDWPLSKSFLWDDSTLPGEWVSYQKMGHENGEP